MKGEPQSVDIQLDTLGLLCPEPVMMLHQKIRQADVGQVIEVIADDPSTQRDIPKFCIFLNHELVSQSERDGQFIYHVKKCDSSQNSAQEKKG